MSATAPGAFAPAPAPRHRVGQAAAIAAALLLAACGESKAANPSSGGTEATIPVGYVVVQPTSVPIEEDLPARISAYQISEVRPQVSGLIHRRLFTEGSIVRQGQTLYQIDPSLYQASVAQAAANLQSAHASAEAADTLATRYQPLAEIEAVAKQDYTNALSQARQANAAIAQNAAMLRTARINLRFTRVPAPITGRIGLSSVTQGALVTADQAGSLATITQLDPINVDIQQSAADLLALRRSLAQGGAAPTTAQVRLLLPDGSDYGATGTVQFSDVIVDPQTGAVAVRARFPNPQSILLPGMFVKARFAQAIDTTAYLVPQQAVSRDPRGNATLWVVGPGNTAVPRTVVTGTTQGAYWVVTQGIAPGEKVIVQGIANLRAGASIRPVPAATPQRIQGQPASTAPSRAGQ
uniref:efflux RND transporter periplasmic adaptor subunit n=1 Tax=Sphingomonas bacterium TaxID=1895847 RepID=UPI00262BC505|nr:efflux RND transporter periplasmic adaptor subunit [Sphingomonas bacterium]